MNLFEFDFYVQVCDISSKNALTNYGILRMMQESACMHSDTLGISINYMDTVPYTWLLINWQLEVYSRPRWKSKLHVKTWPSRQDKLYAYRDYELTDENGNIVAKASSKWIFININTHSIEKMSDDIAKLYKPENITVFDNDIEKLKEPKEQDKISFYKISKRDVDTNNHANNLSYIQIAYECLPDDVYESEPDKMTVLYKKECRLGDDVACIYTKTSLNEHFVTIKSKDLSTLHCIVKFSI